MDFSSNLSLAIPCRACTLEYIQSKMYCLFRDTQLSETFIQFSSIQIHENDGFSTYICQPCYGQLDDFIEFRKMCLRSDETFRQKSVGIKHEQEIDYNIQSEPLSTPSITSCVENVKTEPVERKVQAIQPVSIEVAIKTEDIFEDTYDDDDDEDDNSLNDQLEKKISNGNKKRKKYKKSKQQQNQNEKDTEILVKKLPELREKLTCDACGKIFHKKHRILAHLRQHLGLKPFECQDCNVSFRKWATLSLHNKVHHSNKEFQKFQCTFEGCTKTYNCRQSLKIHMKRLHYGIVRNKSKTAYICETCGKCFTTQFSLKEHNYTHTGETPFPCTQCPKKFISKYKLKIHLMRHNNIRNHVCTECGLRKTTMKELRIHMNMHTQEKTYPCEYCPAVFRNYQNINRHNRIVHRGYKPYVCTYCQRSFSKAETLKHHTMTHTGEKPHACKICDKRFIQAVALKTHMRVHNKHVIFSN